MLPSGAEAMTAMGAPRWSLFFLLTLKDGSRVRAWLGVGDYPVAADDVDAEGGIYLGIGMVGDIPPLRQLVGGIAERVDFALSGVDETTMALANEDASLVKDALVNVGIVFFDEDWQAVAPPSWLWDGTADVIEQEADGAGEQIVRAVKLSVGSAFMDRTRVSLGYYTDADQQRRYPGDTFCARVAGYAIDSTIVWPAPS